jgi:hypothetical protein
MRAIVRSYYDPLILASILRWLRPWEADWGDEDGSNAGSVVAELIARVKATRHDQLRLLIPELLLAVALGKVGSMARETTLAEAQLLLGELEGEARAAIEVGVAVATAL